MDITKWIFYLFEIFFSTEMDKNIIFGFRELTTDEKD